MFYPEQSEDYRPLFWMQGRPVYANTLLLVAHILACVALTLFGAFLGAANSAEALLYDTMSIFRGEVWRLASYIVFPPSIMFIFAMGFLYYWGREVERFVGRKIFMQLYAALVLVPAVLGLLIGLRWPMEHQGGWESIFGVFVAFATIYPGVMLNIWFVELSAKMWAAAIFAVSALFDVYVQDWHALYFISMDAAVGFLVMRLAGAGRGLTWLTDWLERRRGERLARARNFKIVQEKQLDDSMDAILEKISRQGVASLNDRERAFLERARADLIKRDRSG